MILRNIARTDSSRSEVELIFSYFQTNASLFRAQVCSEATNYVFRSQCFVRKVGFINSTLASMFSQNIFPDFFTFSSSTTSSSHDTQIYDHKTYPDVHPLLSWSPNGRIGIRAVHFITNQSSTTQLQHHPHLCRTSCNIRYSVHSARSAAGNSVLRPARIIQSNIEGILQSADLNLSRHFGVEFESPRHQSSSNHGPRYASAVAGIFMAGNVYQDDSRRS